MRRLGENVELIVPLGNHVIRRQGVCLYLRHAARAPLPHELDVNRAVIVAEDGLPGVNRYVNSPAGTVRGGRIIPPSWGWPAGYRIVETMLVKLGGDPRRPWLIMMEVELDISHSTGG
jgi:hypothetical protein